jgi:predicted ATP-dependent endonuclease of OLD family
MILFKARIQNFKSIVDSGEVEVDPKLTILIGKNEQGKSNFLKALESFNEDYNYVASDLTNHLKPYLEEKLPEEVPIVTLWLKLEPDDIEELGSTIDHIENVNHLKIVKSYGNKYKFSILNMSGQESEMVFIPPDISSEIGELKATVSDLKTKLISHSDRNPDFGKSREQFEQLIESLLNANFAETKQIDNLIKTFCAGIRGVPGQDQLVQVDITNATKNLEITLTKTIQTLSNNQFDKNKSLVLMKRLPKFIFHSTSLDKIPDHVNVAEFVAAPAKVSIGMLKLCLAAGLSIQKIQALSKTLSAPERETYEDHYKGNISGGLNEFWKQEEYEVNFRIEKERLSVSISDRTYTQRLSPSQRSDGFQWYLSFYSTIQSERGLSAPTVILLDNPALELHVDGQRDIKRFLEEKVASNAQIIYVTHSPAMVDPFKLEQIRVVELRPGRDGTKISNRIIKEGEQLDILEPVRSAIGTSVGYSLIAANYNILVEGSADKFLMEGILEVCAPEISGSIFVNGSIAESKDCILVEIFNRLHVPFVVVLDADSGGREIAKKLRSKDIPEKNIIEIEKVFPEKSGDFALADIFSEKIYHEAVSIEYSAERIKVDKLERKDAKIENNYEKEFKDKHPMEFKKTRVARQLKKMLIDGIKLDKETSASLDKLNQAILRIFGL